jgi:phosphatidylserine decarboxylase
MPRQGCIASEGYPFIAIAAAIAVGLGILSLWILAGIAAFLCAFIVYFFRNPKRTPPPGDGLVIAPADGRVIRVIPGEPAPETGHPSIKVSIFMSVFNVHVNRFPFGARVTKSVYHPGSFFVASLDKACEKNERSVLVLADDQGREVVLVQIAGLIARRIVCYVREGDRRAAGELFGLIRFGSRVDLYLPPEAEVLVKVGDRVRAGETIIGRLP